MVENLLLVLLSFFVVVRSVFYLVKTSRILNKGVLVEGTVVGSEKLPVYFFQKELPLVEYTTNSGKTFKGVFKPAWLLKRFSSDKKVLVVYDATRPSQFFIDNRLVDLTNFGMLSLGITVLVFSFFHLTNVA